MRGGAESQAVLRPAHEARIFEQLTLDGVGLVLDGDLAEQQKRVDVEDAHAPPSSRRDDKEVGALQRDIHRHQYWVRASLTEKERSLKLASLRVEYRTV